MQERNRSKLSADEELASRRARVSRSESGAVLLERYSVADFFFVRSPLHSFDRLTSWSSSAVDTPRLAGGWFERRQLLVAELRAEFQKPALLEAMFFASSDLEQLISNSSQQLELSPQLLRTLTRYFMRAAGRETPFGSFAGLSLGRIAEPTCLELGEPVSQRHATSVSARHIDQLMLKLVERKGVLDDVRYEPNATLTLIGARYRFARSETPFAPNRPAEDSVTEVVSTPSIDWVLRRARSGATLEELADGLARERLPPPRRALQFVRTLRDLGLLVPTLQPTATGERPLSQAVANIGQIARLSTLARSLASVRKTLADADAAGLGNGLNLYRSVVTKLSRDAKLPLNRHVLQSELLKPAPKLAMSERLAHQFLSAASLIQRTSPKPREAELEQFRLRFVERYESRWVRITEALDSDVGVGFGDTDASATDAFIAGKVRTASAPSEPPFDGFDQSRLSLLHRAIAGGKSVCELDRRYFESLPSSPSPSFPESFSVVARVAQEADGRLLVVAPTVWGSPASLLGRFCAADEQLSSVLRLHLANEQGLVGEALLADVAYYPSDEAANIVVRPVLRGWEIPYRGKSGAPADRQIHLDDLYVTVVEDRVILYSRQHQKQVKIRIANAHNVAHHSLLPIYRFFGALEADDIGLARHWSWGALASSDFLPRVVHRDIVLSLASWRLGPLELEPITSLAGEKAFVALQQLRKTRGLPRWLSRVEGDQRLPVDLDNELSVEELLHEARQQPNLVLDELFPGPDSLPLRSAEAKFAGEFVVPFLRRESVASDPWQQTVTSAFDLVSERRHPPGSAWLYAKIYAPRTELEAILRLIQTEVVELLRNSAFRRWFFLPFADPNHHLRVRFHGSPSKLQKTVLPRLQRALEPLIASGVIWRFQLDTYEQEVERYGGPMGVQLAESVFFADSEATYQLLDVCGRDDELRWQCALLGIDRLLRDFGFDLARRAEFAQAGNEGYIREVDPTVETRRAIGLEYRQHTQLLARMLWQSAAKAKGVWRTILEVFEQRSTLLVPVLGEVQKAVLAGQIQASVDGLAHSFAHMHAVRLLGPTARSFELVLYDFLKRQYRARVARGGGDDVTSSSRG